MFGDYPVQNARFSDAEAGAARLYTPDFKALDTADMTRESVIRLSSPTDPCQPARSVAKVRIHGTGESVRGLDLLDEKENLIKSVEYEYVQRGGESALRRQKVLLPESRLTVGFQKGGIEVTMGGEKRTYTELPCIHHKGLRQCLVEYQPTQIGAHSIPLPAKASVQDVPTKGTLRCVHMSDFKPTTLNKEEIRRTAERFSHFNSEMLACRAMATKHWLKDPDTYPEADTHALKQLQAHFENGGAVSGTTGEQLRRLNMLLQLDWMLADTGRLADHYDQYLKLLESHDMDQMVLVGGQRVIETTVLWGYLATADALLSKWVKHAVSVCDDASVCQFAFDELRRGDFWSVANLMKTLVERRQSGSSLSCEAHALRCIALWRLYQCLAQPEKLKREFDVMQTGWVSRSTNVDALLSAFEESLMIARRSFTLISQPTPIEKVLMAELDKLNESSGTKSLDDSGP